MERTISKADRESLVRFAEIYTTLSEENKKLVFAFAQGMETQRLIAQGKPVTSRTAAGV